MAIRTFVLTDQWKTPSMGDAEGTGSILRHGISGDVTLTPVVPPGLRVEDDPRAWAMLSRPLRASYHLGRLIGPDGRDGVRLLGWVDDQPVSWRVQRELRFNGERLPRLSAVTITPAGDVVHLPDAAPVDEADMEAIGQVLVDLGAVRAELAAAGDAAGRAEVARDQAVASAEAVAVDAADVGEAREYVSGVHQAMLPGGWMVESLEAIADSAQEAAWSAEDARDAAAGSATDAKGHADRAATKAGEAAASATLADGHATAAQGHADRAATEAGAAAQIAAQEKIAELVGDAPEHLDTIYELAAAFEERGDAIAAIQDALANRVVGNHSSVISSTIPGPGTPTNQITFVVEGT